MIRTRRNRQTGTVITVGRSAELGFNDGEGWALLCETHSIVMQCDTRTQADRQAAAPAGWCGDCEAQLRYLTEQRERDERSTQ